MSATTADLGIPGTRPTWNGAGDGEAEIGDGGRRGRRLPPQGGQAGLPLADAQRQTGRGSPQVLRFAADGKPLVAGVDPTRLLLGQWWL
jgi:hypothetical protein